MAPPLKSRQTKSKTGPLRMRLIVTAVVACVGFGGLWLAHTIFKPAPQALQDAIVKQFGGKPGAVIPNVPSRVGRYPGAVLAVSPKGSELLVRSMERPATLPAPSGFLKGVELASSSAALELAGRAFGSKIEGNGDAVVHLDLQDIRIFEQEASKLAEALRNDESVGRARASGQSVVVVTKSYEAIPTVIVHQRSDSKSEDWARLKGELTKANGRVTADETVEFRSSAPQVVAYETSEVSFLADNFSPGGVKIEVQSTRMARSSLPFPRSVDFGSKPVVHDVAFAVISSPSYSALSFGDLPAASASASLVAGLFEATGAQPVDTGLFITDRLTTDGFAAARKKIVEALKTRKPRAFVLYYAGHAVSGMSGSHYLVMGDYRGNLTNDLKQSSPFVPARGASHPLAGSNIDDIAKVIAAAGQEFAASEPGLIAVAELHREFAETGVPFAIVVDGCYPADAMDKLRAELRFTPWGDYYGLGEGAMRETEEYQRVLRTYGEAPYLRSENPVIFAARPGTLAPVVRHPLYDKDWSTGVGPLSSKLFGAMSYALMQHEDLSVGGWLRRITDFAGTGELDVKGSISWSKFDRLHEVPLVSF